MPLAGGAAPKAVGIEGPRALQSPTGHLVEHAAMDLVGALLPGPAPAE